MCEAGESEERICDDVNEQKKTTPSGFLYINLRKK
jgi:hypothetical protein